MSDYENKSFDVQKLKSQMESKIKALWAGEVPLFETFWIYYFAVVVVLQLVGGAFGALWFLFFVVSLGWAGFMVRPIWLASDKYAGPKHWAMLAKIAAILIAIGIVTAIF